MELVQNAYPSPMITELDIKRAERSIGLRFPPRYREFLLRFTGERLERTDYDDPDNPYIVTKVFRLDEVVRTASNYLDALVEFGMIPFAKESGGNLFLVDTKTDGVYFWGLFDEEDAVPVKLEENVQQFFDKLIRCDAPSTELEKMVERQEYARIDEWVRVHGVMARDEIGRSLADLAMSAGNVYLLERCIALGFDRRGLLHRASMRSNVQLIEFLLETGSDVNEENENGSTPLDIATNEDAIRFLKSRGAKRNRGVSRS